ncbi:hypothetical protein Hanom_Chr15g01351471 [Helianthus anomalus]
MTGNWTDDIQEIRVDEAPPTQPVPSTLPYHPITSSLHTGSGTQRASDGVACCLFISFLSHWFTN